MQGMFLRRAYPSPVCTITITKAGSSQRCWLKIGGETVYEVGTYEVTRGDVIVCCTDGALSSTEKTVKVNGVQVQGLLGTSTSEYKYTVKRNITVSFTSSTSKVAIEITEE